MTLIKRGSKYSVRYVIPTKLRDVLGKSQVWKTTDTGCLSEAKRREPRILADIIDSVEAEYDEAVLALTDKDAPPNLSELTQESLARANDPEDDFNASDAGVVLENAMQAHLKAIKARSKSDRQRHSNPFHTARKIVGSGGNFMPLEDAIKQHIADLEDRGRNRSTVDRKQKVLEAFSEFAGDPSVSEVDRRMAGRWIEEELKPQKLAVATKEWHIGALKAAWTYFVLSGQTDTNPWERMNMLVQDSTKGKHKEYPERAWTQDELDKIKVVDATDPIHTVSVIRLHSGIRVEEACCLKVADIDLKDNVMHIREGKTQSSIRTLPLHPVLQKLMPELLEKEAEDGYLFDMKPAGRDKRRSHNFVKRIGRWVRKNVTKDSGVTQYTLRHTYCQALRDLGVDRETIEFTTGHKDQSMLFGTYAKQVSVERLREGIEKLDFGF